MKATQNELYEKVSAQFIYFVQMNSVSNPNKEACRSVLNFKETGLLTSKSSMHGLHANILYALLAIVSNSADF